MESNTPPSTGEQLPPCNTEVEAAKPRDEAAWHTNAYINDYIRFADAKAGVVIAIMSALLWALLKHIADPPTNIATTWTAVVATVIALGVGLFVVWPRTPSARRGLFFWGNIAAHKDADEYAEAFLNATEVDIAKGIVLQNYYLSVVAVGKYDVFRWCCRAAAVAGFTGVLALGDMRFIESIWNWYEGL